MVDTWAAASAGSMSLTENSLYTVEGWRIFYEHLKPDGILTMTRWNMGAEASQTARMFAVGWATLLEEGAENPAEHLALVGAGPVATILLSKRPLTFEDRGQLKSICSAMEFRIVFLNGEATPPANLPRIGLRRRGSGDGVRRHGAPDHSYGGWDRPVEKNPAGPGVAVSLWLSDGLLFSPGDADLASGTQRR